MERVQRTALEEFWPTVDLKDPDLKTKLAEWQHFYNWERPHDSLGGLAPIDRLRERLDQAPTSEEIAAAFDPTREFILARDYWPRPRSQPQPQPQPQ